MASITRFLADTLKLTVNVAKSTVAQPWKRKFLGYSLAWHKAPRLKIASNSLKRLEELDGWIRRKLRCILWRQWKRPYTRAKN
ncbi:Group II intron, maturase-specific domain [Nitrosomonas sp. Nm51]|uniref:group II intron maturase-specific domain-containing protein n=1 Tax=Nitrosomonas sp. Nm51 TaxID=133720 RepID=UPI0008C2CDBB|nr:group II intron maturase-specific domain-containing protein [Nitrosomonas sp. Nm51]SER68675.1 Group II intron, maturase-specific domain [Nitrosomonas sp. Nm51]